MIARDSQNESGMAFGMREQNHVHEKGVCKIYGRYGHDESVYYEVIGYLLGWGTCGRGRGNKGGRDSKSGRGGSKAGRGVSRESALAAVHVEGAAGPITGTCQAISGTAKGVWPAHYSCPHSRTGSVPNEPYGHAAARIREIVK